jgi:hypothetical protein
MKSRRRIYPSQDALRRSGLNSKAARSSRSSISSRNSPKSIGLVSSPAALSSAAHFIYRFISIGGDHHHRRVRQRRLRAPQGVMLRQPRPP